jgi:hypothetical protein
MAADGQILPRIAVEDGAVLEIGELPDGDGGRSARTTAPYQTETPRARLARPQTTAFSAMKTPSRSISFTT